MPLTLHKNVADSDSRASIQRKVIRKSEVPLESEIEFYKTQEKALLTKHPGKFVLVKNREIIGIFPSKREAYDLGYEKFGNVTFLVRQIQSKQPSAFLPV